MKINICFNKIQARRGGKNKAKNKRDQTEEQKIGNQEHLLSANGFAACRPISLRSPSQGSGCLALTSPYSLLQTYKSERPCNASVSVQVSSSSHYRKIKTLAGRRLERGQRGTTLGSGSFARGREGPTAQCRPQHELPPQCEWRSLTGRGRCACMEFD